MEDTHVTIDDFSNHSEFGHLKHYSKIAFFGVYDGHGGKTTAEDIQKILHPLIVGSREFLNKDVDNALIKGFAEADAYCVSQANESGYMNGCTAVVGLILDGHLHIANLGDSEAILISDTDPVENLTMPHKANIPSEKQRIEALGGHVFFNRVFGTLAVSRAFGDSKYKQPKTTQNFVSCEPALKSVQLTPNHKFLILACDGLWDVCTHEEVAGMVKGQSDKTPTEIANFLVAEALRKRSEDNITVIVTKINWEQTENPSPTPNSPATPANETNVVNTPSQCPATPPIESLPIENSVDPK